MKSLFLPFRYQLATNYTCAGFCPDRSAFPQVFYGLINSADSRNANQGGRTLLQNKSSTDALARSQQRVPKIFDNSLDRPILAPRDQYRFFQDSSGKFWIWLGAAIFTRRYLSTALGDLDNGEQVLREAIKDNGTTSRP
jgi:hypothetical protein